MFTSTFWLGDGGALVRAIRTFAQTAAALIAASAFSPFDVGAWGNVAVVAGTSALLSLLMSLDRRESLMADPSAVKAAPVTVYPPYSDPSSATYQPEFLGNLR